MKRILVIAFGGPDCASTQYRFHAMDDLLRQRGIELEIIPAADFSNWDSLKNYDAVVIQKRLFSPCLVQRIRRRTRRLFYDVDDAIWHPHGRPHSFLTRWKLSRRLKAIAAAADVCLCANSVLADEVRRWARHIELVPMSLNPSVWNPASTLPDHPVRIGWAGAPKNLKYLEAIEPALAKVLSAAPNVELAVYSGSAPSLSIPFQHIPFSEGTEADAVRSFSIGLLPLEDTPFARAKSPIKGLQYLACGVPAVVAPFGAVTDIQPENVSCLYARSLEEWEMALKRFVLDADLRTKFREGALQHFQEHYSIETVADRLAAILSA